MKALPIVVRPSLCIVRNFCLLNGYVNYTL